jgi:hypothetical protein
MRSLRRFAFALSALALLAASGCAKKPTMHLDHAVVQGVQLSVIPPQLGVLMIVTVDVFNPNSYDVAVRSMTGSVTMVGGYPMPISFQAPGDGVWLPAGQTTPMSVPVQVPVPLALSVLQQAYYQPTIQYRMTGKANVTATRTFKIEADDYSVDETGQIDRQQIAAAVQGIMAPHPLIPGAPIR